MNLIRDYGAVAACFIATLLTMAALRPVAVAVELVDKPGGRKTHHGDVPVVGGLAMFLGIVFGFGLLPDNQLLSAPVISAAALVVLVGLLDDRFEISPYARLTAHLVAAVLVFTTSPSLTISSLGHAFGPDLVQFPAWAPRPSLAWPSWVRSTPSTCWMAWMGWPAPWRSSR